MNKIQSNEKKVKIINETGLHARPASEFVKKASCFSSEINITFEGRTVNAKSIMGVMSLGVGKGKTITIEAEGDDANKALDELEEFIRVEMPKEDENN